MANGIDTSIYRTLQAPDLVGAVDQGMRMSDMIKTRRKADAKDQAYKAGVVTNPDGTTTVDRAKTASALAGAGLVEESQAFDRQTMADKKSAFEQKAQQMELIGQVVGGVKDQASYEHGMKMLGDQGVDISGLPQQYDPSLVAGYGRASKTFLDQQYREKSLENAALDRKEARDERRYQSGVKLEDKMYGLKTPYGIANTETDAKDLKTAHESKRNFDSQLQELIALRKKHSGGAVLNRDDVSRASALSKDLLLEYKNMAKLGVMSAADEKILNAIIPPDPLQYNSPLAAIQGQDPILSGLEKFKASKDEEFQTKVSTRLRDSGSANVAIQRAAPAAQQAETASTPPKQGTVVDGYVFMGGDASQQSSWKPVKSSVARKQE